jgi:hypothetical protein
VKLPAPDLTLWIRRGREPSTTDIEPDSGETPSAGFRSLEVQADSLERRHDAARREKTRHFKVGIAGPTTAVPVSTKRVAPRHCPGRKDDEVSNKRETASTSLV